ncbi:serine/threonine receptor-like kinase NFP [Rhodamnia argentea]|uniref:Serine/threonine receptor-like kinase NFP n=1 Tax=Rhodamnia argentea TaxID=178133 RepID=A0A8B8P488_9MYRT|nr:serine/threonine receptor-like kinase NFP [Rhodamnia argentea]
MASFLFSSKALPFLLFLFFSCTQILAQSPGKGANFSCFSDSMQSCDTYVAYFAQPPDFMDVGNISDLFGVSRLSIIQASNLTSEDDVLVEGQLLLVPIKCGCNGTSYFSNVTYEIKKGDSYYLVSIHAFENLTNWPTVEDANPSLNPSLLNIGTRVAFPLFCRCPSKAQSEAGLNLFITYVWQTDDQVSTVASKFNATPGGIVAENNQNNFTSVIDHPVLIPVSQLPILSQNYSSIPSKRRTNHRWLLVIVTSSVCTVLVFLLGISLVCTHSKPKKEKALDRNGSWLETSDLIQAKEFARSKSFEQKAPQDKLLPGVSGYLGKPIMYDVRAIMEATADLSEHWKIGKSVFRANIDGEILAIKKVKDESSEEVKILQRVYHANLVKLMGVASDIDGPCFLVYEYVHNGPLSKWLHQKCTSSSGSVVLMWIQRLRIALDVANGLQYLHEHAQPNIVHGDIRASNVLLDSTFKAKISNFSMAKPATSSAELKADTFAFGVVLLELLSGKKAMGMKDSGEIGMLWREIREVLDVDDGDRAKREERLRKWMDPNMEGSFPMEGALSLACLARTCTVERPCSRPSMAEIVFNLSVLTHSCAENLVGSWASPRLEDEEVVRIISPIKAR